MHTKRDSSDGDSSTDRDTVRGHGHGRSRVKNTGDTSSDGSDRRCTSGRHSDQGRYRRSAKHNQTSKRLTRGRRNRGGGDSGDDSSSNDSRSSDDQSTDRDQGTRQGGRFMRASHYSGCGSVETFIIQFELCTDYNKWSEADKVIQLKCCLTGIAAQMLWDGGVKDNMSYRKVVSRLKARFGSGELHERFAVELRSRRRRADETIAELHADIRRLMALAYPDRHRSFVHRPGNCA